MKLNSLMRTFPILLAIFSLLSAEVAGIQEIKPPVTEKRTDQPMQSKQEFRIAGVVIDAETGAPINGAHILVAESGDGAISDRDGRFTISLKRSDLQMGQSESATESPESAVDKAKTSIGQCKPTIVPIKTAADQPETSFVPTTAAVGQPVAAVNQLEITLVVTHIGYQTRRLVVDNVNDIEQLTVSLVPAQVISEELIVTAGSQGRPFSALYSEERTRPVEDHLSAASGVHLVTRTNFARDPVVRGMRDHRLDVTLDGMRVTPACVDGMDPVTAYIETDNLQSIELNRGGMDELQMNGVPGGSVDFVMRRPELSTGWSGRSEIGFHTVSGQQVYQGSAGYGGEKWAVRSSGTYRNSGNLHAGGGLAITGSELEKGNLTTSVLFQPNESHQLTLRYIGDFAGRIGYPSLLMDTRRADAHIGGLRHLWRVNSGVLRKVETNLYLNRVAHWMDDYTRDVASREVMQNMYMPMYGETLTAGFSSEARLLSGSHLLSVELEAYRLEAFGDMKMIHIDPDVSEMYLLNLGDLTDRRVSLSAGYRYFGFENWIIGWNGRIEQGFYRLRDERAVATFRAEYPGLVEVEPEQTGYRLGLELERNFSERFAAGLKLNEGTRLPGHMELYGYYVYQPLDGFFYHGNPGLGTERSSQAELYLSMEGGESAWDGSLSVWVNRLNDFITGERVDALFKRYENLGRALLTGFEADLRVQLSPGWRAEGSASWVVGEHIELEEPLPMIPPLQGQMSLQRRGERFGVQGRLRWAAAQNRIAAQNSLEAATDRYLLWDLFVRFAPADGVRLQAGVENLLNRFYTDHLNVNSMPGPGRNVHLSLSYSF